MVIIHYCTMSVEHSLNNKNNFVRVKMIAVMDSETSRLFLELAFVRVYENLRRRCF